MKPTWPHTNLPDRVIVETQARLHLGFLDMSGALGRRFGSLGLSIDSFRTRLRVSPSREVGASGPGAARASRYARQMLQQLDPGGGVHVELLEGIPDHLGLGSGTQMALAVGRAIATLYGSNIGTRDVAQALQRGARSGIGIGAFDEGGFLLDSGVGDDGAVPPVTARMDYPEAWRAILVMDVRGQGLHGAQEIEAFRRLPPFPRETAAHLCHLTVMQILPGLREQQLQPVAEGIAELQRLVGDHFAPAQGGRFTSPAVAEALDWAAAQGYSGVGQSSWGPTGFVLLPGQAEAEELRQAARARFGDLSPLRFLIAAPCNRGSLIQSESTVEAVKDVR
jgi:beta-RFAP synthase